jgi:hypothetical protein
MSNGDITPPPTTRVRRTYALRGEEHPQTAFHSSDILRIRDEYAAGARSADIAERFGISVCQVGRIVNGSSWSHLTGGISLSRTKGIRRYSKLTPDQVREIIVRYESDRGLNKSALGREFGISRQQILAILTGRWWHEITQGIDRTRKASV